MGGAALILTVQRDLYHLMAEIAATPENAARFRYIDVSRVAGWKRKPMHSTWLRCRGNLSSQAIHLPGPRWHWRAPIVRRAERRVAWLYHEQVIQNPELLHYLNRLSSLCFVLELYENQTKGSTTPTLAKG